MLCAMRHAECTEVTQGLLLLLLWVCLAVLAVGLMLVARAGPRVATSLLLLLTFAQGVALSNLGVRPALRCSHLVAHCCCRRFTTVVSSVFSPHWLHPTEWMLPDVFNTITAVLNSPTILTLLDCTDWRYERIFVLTVTQPAQMLATFGLLFVPCYWSDCLRAS